MRVRGGARSPLAARGWPSVGLRVYLTVPASAIAGDVASTTTLPRARALTAATGNDYFTATFATALPPFRLS